MNKGNQNKFDYYLKETIVDKKGKPPKINTKGQFLVWKFCRDPFAVNWGKENKFAKILLEKYPFGLWQKIELKKRTYSLHWFTTKDGEEFLRKENLKSELVFKAPVEHVLQEKKVGRDRKIHKKNKTILELLTDDAERENREN